MLFSDTEQAIGRVHRIGQTRTVHVTRLVVSNTVEDKILEMQKRKADLAKFAITGEAERLTTNEILSVLGVQPAR